MKRLRFWLVALFALHPPPRVVVSSSAANYAAIQADDCPIAAAQHEPGELHGLAERLDQSGEPSRAAACFLAAIEAAGADHAHHVWRVHNNLGLLLRRNGRLDEAVFAYDAALAVLVQEGHAGAQDADGAGDVWYNRANTLSVLGRHAEAVASFQNALELQGPRQDIARNLEIARQQQQQQQQQQMAAAEIIPETRGRGGHRRQSARRLRDPQAACELLAVLAGQAMQPPWTRTDTGRTLCELAKTIPPRLLPVFDGLVVETRLFPEADRAADLALRLAGPTIEQQRAGILVGGGGGGGGGGSGGDSISGDSSSSSSGGNANLDPIGRRKEEGFDMLAAVARLLDGREQQKAGAASGGRALASSSLPFWKGLGAYAQGVTKGIRARLSTVDLGATPHHLWLELDDDSDEEDATNAARQPRPPSVFIAPRDPSIGPRRAVEMVLRLARELGYEQQMLQPLAVPADGTRRPLSQGSSSIPGDPSSPASASAADHLEKLLARARGITLVELGLWTGRSSHHPYSARPIRGVFQAAAEGSGPGRSSSGGATGITSMLKQLQWCGNISAVESRIADIAGDSGASDIDESRVCSTAAGAGAGAGTAPGDGDASCLDHHSQQQQLAGSSSRVVVENLNIDLQVEMGPDGRTCGGIGVEFHAYSAAGWSRLFACLERLGLCSEATRRRVLDHYYDGAVRDLGYAKVVFAPAGSVDKVKLYTYTSL